MISVEEITVEVRSLALGMIGQVDLEEVSDLKLIKRFNNVGSWSLSLPADLEIAVELAKPGRGILVTTDDGKVLMSGPLLNWFKVEDVEDPEGYFEYTGADDMIHLADHTAFPEPSNPDTSTQSASHDVRSGVRETVIREYVAYNITHDLGTPERRVDNLYLRSGNLERGGTLSAPVRARYPQLGKLLSEVAGTHLGFNIEQVGNQLEFYCYQPEDKRDLIRMDIDNDLLQESKYGFAAPKVTRPIVAGQGEGVERTIIQVTSPESLAAELEWGRKIEHFVDRRDTDESDELTQTGTELLNEGGKTITSLSVVPADEDTMVYGRDWFLGDIVGVVVDDQPLHAIVTESIIMIDSDGIRVGATIGDPVGFDYESKLIAQQQQQEERIGRLERSDPGGGTSELESTIQALNERLSRLAWAEAAGDVIVPGGSGTRTSATFTFPANRFTVPPKVAKNAETTVPAGDNETSGVFSSSIASITATGATAYVVRSNATNTIIGWIAVQMTESGANG